MKKKAAIQFLMMLSALLVLAGCRTPAKSDIRSVSGVLSHFPSNVRTAQAWYGHNFMVGDSPVQPTATVPESMLLECVGKVVRVTGTWNPGFKWTPTEEEKDFQRPVEPEEDGPVIRGDGIRAETLTIMKDK